MDYNNSEDEQNDLSPSALEAIDAERRNDYGERRCKGIAFCDPLLGE